MSHVHINRNKIPNVIDNEGDTWAWTDSDINGDAGYRIIKRGDGSPVFMQDEINAHDLSYLREAWGPITEVPVDEPATDVIKLPTVPDDVIKLKVVGSNQVFERSGAYWVKNNPWGYDTCTLAEILSDRPEGLELVRETALDKAVKYFRNASASNLGLIKYGENGAEHAAVIVQHYLDNHAEQ